MVGGNTPTPYDAPPTDTGEAQGLPASGLTLTFGFGPSLFESDGKDRFGLADRRPAALRELPHFPADNLDPTRSDGDLCVQACAHDPQVAVHAIRNLARIGFGTVAMRWAQLGFGRTSSTSTQQQTAAQPARLQGRHRQPQGRGPHRTSTSSSGCTPATTPPATGSPTAPTSWPAGSTCTSSRGTAPACSEQETLIGRDRAEGAPLSGGKEFTEPNFELQGRNGPLIAVDSHVRLAHPTMNKGVKLLRRGYNFTDGSNALGRLDAGLFFIAFVRDPVEQYIPMQTRLSAAGRPDGVPPAHRVRPVRRTPGRAVALRVAGRDAVLLGRRAQTSSKRMPAACRRRSRFSAIAWAVVTWPEVCGLSSRARQSADSASIFAVSS